MKVQSIAGLSTVPVSNLVRAQVVQGSITLPVDSSQFLYAHLKHIRGIPSPVAGGGYSLSRLRAVDNLIDRLRSLKGENAVLPPVKAGEGTGDSRALQEQLENLRKQLNETIRSRALPFRGYEGLDAGLTLNLSV